MEKENRLILFTDNNGKVSINVRFANEDVWLTREHLAEIYATTPQNISLHIGNIYQDGELTEEATRKKFFLVRQEGSRKVKREIDHYNLNMIIALGYRRLSAYLLAVAEITCGGRKKICGGRQKTISSQSSHHKIQHSCIMPVSFLHE